MTTEELLQKYRTTSPGKAASFINMIWRVKDEMSALSLMAALGKILDTEVEERRAIGRKGSGMTSGERQALEFSAKVVACLLVLLCDTRSRKEASSRALLFLEYASYLSKSSYDLAATAVNCCSYPMTHPGFSWYMIENAISTDFLAYKMLDSAKFDRRECLSPADFTGAGLLSLSGGRLNICSSISSTDRVKAFEGHGGLIGVYTRNVRSERLKATGAEDSESLAEFADTFLKVQTKATGSPRGIVREEGNYTIKYQSGCGDYIHCVPQDAFYDGPGEIEDEELVKGLYTRDLTEYLYENDCIEGAVLIDENEPPLFSIKETYQRFALRQADKDRRTRRVHNALVIDVFNGITRDKDRLRLISDNGYGGLMRDSGRYGKGDIAIVYTHSIRNDNGNIYINMDEPNFPYSDEPDEFDREHLLDGFVMPEETEAEHLCGKQAENASGSAGTFRSLGIILSFSRDKSPITRYRDYLSAAFIFNVLGDTDALSGILSKAEFLLQCLRFAEGHPVQTRNLPDKLPERERRIIKALASPEDLEGLVRMLTEAEGDDEKEILKLLAADAISRSEPDEVKVTGIRRHICRLLDVEGHFRETEDKGGGKYGLGELANVEFKASYVISNSDGKPDIYRQGRGQVWEAVCGFLNKDGGTVYIGVNNYGDPLRAENSGLNADLEWFRRNFSTFSKERSRQLGHPVPQPKDLDTYCLLLNDEMELYFKPAVRSCITITPTEDMDAIMIIVRPSEFEIAKLYTDNQWKDGTVYVRNGEETVPMKRHDQEQRLMKLRSVGKVEQFILTLGEAIDQKRKVLLKGYASSNSNEVRDRLVVPVNFVCGNENLWAYDLEAKAFKGFRLARISSIETELDEPEYPHAFEKGEADVFRWVDPNVSYHIKLEMTIAALNSLREEYSDARNLPPEELYRTESGSWILDTRLHGLRAARRFCIGLADQIRILDTEDADALRAEIRSFVAENLTQA